MAVNSAERSPNWFVASRRPTLVDGVSVGEYTGPTVVGSDDEST